VKQVIIREVVSSDAAVLIKLIEQLGYSITLSELQANIELCLNDKHYSIFVAEVQDEICGFIGVVIARWLHRDGAWAKVLALVVDEEQRGAKIGSELLNFAENYAKTQGCDKIELTSGLHRRQSGAHKFYLSHGYQSDLTQHFMKKLS
jgi:GNAT superfamily N-acetyltransferase